MGWSPSAETTSAVLGIPPELQGIKTPMAISGTAREPQGSAQVDFS
jgi:hypothetical protein